MLARRWTICPDGNMITTTTDYWKAFFDPQNHKHQQAVQDLEIFDKEKIILSQITLAEVSSWLTTLGKTKQAEWFLSFANDTANVRVFHFGKEEFEKVIAISIKKRINYSDACLEYLHKNLNCDITDDY